MDRRRNLRSFHICRSLDRVKNEADDRSQTPPRLGLSLKLLLSRSCQFVVLRLTVVIGNGPLCLDPSAPFQPMQRRIERALANLQRIARYLLDALRDAPAMLRAERQR